MQAQLRLKKFKLNRAKDGASTGEKTMNTLKIEKNQNSKKYKYSLIWIGFGTVDNPKYCIGNFSNKFNATKMMNFLNWYQKRFECFADYQEASARLANAASQSNIEYI